MLLLISLLAAASAVAVSPTCDHTPAELEALNDATVAALKKNNFNVVEGELKVFNSSSFGANPGNPYVTYFHPTSIIEKNLPIFELKPQTAVLFMGCTPSTPAYFSWRSYAFISRAKPVFASLGDSLNNLVMNTTSTNGSPGGHATAVVTTADQATLSAVSAAVQSAGLPSSAINLDAVPSSLVNMRYDPTLRFLMLHRASIWGDDAQKEAYFAQSRRIFFIDPPSGTAAQPIPLLPLRRPGTGVTEAGMHGITDGMANLKQGVISAMERAGYKSVDAGFNGGELASLGLDGFKCLEQGTQCKGDNRDTHYLQYHDDAFKDTDAYVLIGTNSVKTSKCTYTNFGLYQVYHEIFNRTKLTSTDLTVDHRKFLGSTKQYGVEDDRFFAFQISRDCSGRPFCLQVGPNDVPEGVEWAVAYRPYLEPATKTGPELAELVIPTVLKFSKA